MTPDKKYIGVFLVGALWGAVIMFIGGAVYLRHSLIVESECRQGLEETAAKIAANAKAYPAWTVQQVPCAASQASDGSKIAAFRFCNQGYAKMIVEDPSDRKFSCAIPCALSLYQKPDGKTYMARLNMPLLARIIGGIPAELFPERIAPEQRMLLSGILKSP